MRNKYIITALLLTGIVIFTKNDLRPENTLYPPHIATEIKAERIKFINDSIRISWKMDKKYTGDFIVGRSEKEISTTNDALNAKLIGIFNPDLDGILIDRDVQQGKKYYYIVLAKDLLLKRNIDIIKNVNYTHEPVSLFMEPESVQSLKAEIYEQSKIRLNWQKSSGDNIKYNVYRSRSVISSKGELEVAEKISVTDKNEYTDASIPDYGSYFYAVTITDRNSIEYFNPKPNQNYITNGIYLKGKAYTTPLNLAAFPAEKNSIILKWEKSESKYSKEIQGYDIYRSDEIINTLLKLKFSKIIQTVDKNTTTYTDKDLEAGKYYYAVFLRYSDGTIDINFDTDTNYTKTPLMITLPYIITSINYETADKQLILRWNYTGNSGNETVDIFKSSIIPADSSKISKEDIIGNSSIRTGKFVVTTPPAGEFYYGLLCRKNSDIIKITKGVNITSNAIKPETLAIEKKKKSDETIIQPKTDNDLQNKGLEFLIRNTYYRGRYPLALKELKKFIEKSDNEYDKSKARLFIAKSYIEMYEYRKSIKILERDDVKKNFPDEAKFWYEFAIVRIK